MSHDVVRIAGTLIRLTRVLDQRTRQAMPGDDLGLIDLSVLSQLERGNDLPSGVARGLHLDPARITRIIDHLVLLEYVERRPDAEDRRRCRVVLSPAGEQRLAEGKAQVTRVMAQVLDGLSAEERTGLELGLEGARRVLDELLKTHHES
jgi:DNA-binding MarR family transcriptional regulator